MITLAITQAFLGWCTVLNMGLVLIWFLLFTYAHDWLYRFHSRFFRVNTEQFDALHYAGMMIYKIGLWLFFLMPYLALRIAA